MGSTWSVARDVVAQLQKKVRARANVAPDRDELFLPTGNFKLNGGYVRRIFKLEKDNVDIVCVEGIG